jgi:hypothetical protein
LAWGSGRSGRHIPGLIVRRNGSETQTDQRFAPGWACKTEFVAALCGNRAAEEQRIGAQVVFGCSRAR